MQQRSRHLRSNLTTFVSCILSIMLLLLPKLVSCTNLKCLSLLRKILMPSIMLPTSPKAIRKVSAMPILIQYKREQCPTLSNGTNVGAMSNTAERQSGLRDAVLRRFPWSIWRSRAKPTKRPPTWLRLRPPMGMRSMGKAPSVIFCRTKLQSLA